jgi:hypothetical protein
MEGIDFLRELRLRRTLEQETMSAELEMLQRYVPSAVFVTRGKAAAVAVSLELNLSVANNAGTSAAAVEETVVASAGRPSHACVRVVECRCGGVGAAKFVGERWQGRE